MHERLGLDDGDGEDSGASGGRVRHWGVLERTHGFPWLAARWEGRLGLAPGAFEQRLRQSGLGRDATLGMISEEEFHHRLAELYGMDRRTLEEFVADQWDWYMGELNTEIASYFQGLRPRYRTATLSNSMVGARQQEQARYGLAEMTDLLVYSHEEGTAKPDPRIYRTTCDRLGVRPEETVFLDDTEECAAAARALGMRAVLFQSTTQAIADIEDCLS